MRKPSAKHQRRPGPSSDNWSGTGAAPARPLAVTLDQAAELLAIPRSMAARLAAQIEPYQHNDGSARWPLRELARAPADCGGIRARAELD